MAKVSTSELLVTEDSETQNGGFLNMFIVPDEPGQVGGVRALTEVCVGQVVAVGVAPVGEVFPGASVHGAGLGDGLDQVLVVGVPPAPPADLGLAAAGDDGPRRLVPGGGGERAKLSETRNQSKINLM